MKLGVESSLALPTWGLTSLVYHATPGFRKVQCLRPDEIFLRVRVRVRVNVRVSKASYLIRSRVKVSNAPTRCVG